MPADVQEIEKYVSEVFERRNEAFRVLYDTVIEVERSGQKELYPLLCKNLKKLCKAEYATLVSFDLQRNTALLEAVASTLDPECSTFSDKIAILLDKHDLQILLQQSICKCCQDQACCLMQKFPNKPGIRTQCDMSKNCYTLVCKHENDVLAAGFIQMPPHEKLKNKDLVETYLNFSGIVLQRIKQKKELMDSKEQFRLLFEKANDAILIIRGNRVISCNQRTAEMFASRKEVITGKRIHELSAPVQKDGCNARAKALEYIVSALKGDCPFFEWTHQREDGSTWLGEVSLNCFEVNNQRFVQAIIRDITGRKQAEERQLQLLSELEKANRELREMQGQMIQQEKMAGIGQLAAGVAHEINNPMGFVGSNCQVMQNYFSNLMQYIKITLESIEKIHSEYQGFPLQTLHEAREKYDIDFILQDMDVLFSENNEGINRIIKIIQNMRDFSRIDQVGEYIAFCINKGIKSTLIVANSEIQTVADVKLELGKVPDIYCNPGLLNQVFLNLLINAVHAIASQEKTEKGLIHIRTFEQNACVVCEIEDNGPGIPVEIRTRIFDPFFTTKPPGKGTGLGLSISYDIIVNKHKGSIAVFSELQKGTKFQIVLPQKPTAEELKEPVI